MASRHPWSQKSKAIVTTYTTTDETGEIPADTEEVFIHRTPPSPMPHHHIKRSSSTKSNLVSQCVPIISVTEDRHEFKARGKKENGKIKASKVGECMKTQELKHEQKKRKGGKMCKFQQKSPLGERTSLESMNQSRNGYHVLYPTRLVSFSALLCWAQFCFLIFLSTVL